MKHRTARSLLIFASLPFLFFLLIPLAGLIQRVSWTTFRADLADGTIHQAIMLSLTTTLVTLAITLVGGTPLAYLLARRRFWGHSTLDTLVDLPMVLPPAVAGIALLIAFGREGVIAQFFAAHFRLITLPQVVFTPAAVVMAQIFVAAPFYVRAATTALGGVAREIEDAATIDGANSWQVWQHITLRLAYPGLLAGAIMTWARALGEFGATIIFAGNFPGTTQTIPLAIYIGFSLHFQTALALSAMLLGIAFVILLVVRVVLHQPVTN